MANGSILYPLLVACLLVGPSFQSLYRHDGDSAISSLRLDIDKSFQGCDQNLELKKASCSNKGLDTVPQNLSDDTKVLDLSHNNITILLNSSFEVYPLINSLDISHNDVRSIESGTFYPLKGLINLSLLMNQHLVLPATGVFMMSSQLSMLDLTKTNLKSLPDDILKWSPHLDLVVLFENRLSFINVSSCGMDDQVYMTTNHIKHLTAGDFTFVCNTTILNLIQNPIQSVDPDVIASLHVRSLMLGGYPLSDELLTNIILGISKSDIDELIIQRGSVGAFPKGFFDPLRDSSLSLLYLERNKLKSLHPLVFSNLTKLKEFIFNYNELPIDIIHPDFFEGMKALKGLIMNNNQVTQINPQNQTWTVDLSELDLSGNMITNISTSVFRGLGNLTFLNMSYNRLLAVFELTAFSGLDNIQTIDLSGCQLYTILELNTPILRSLFLNSINPLNVGVSIKPASFQHLHSLVNLYMKDSGLDITNNIWNGNASLFDGLLHLNHLDLSKNPFPSFLPPGVFRQLSVLQELNLEYCQIGNLHPLVFSGLESLQKLSLKGNNIQHIHDDVLSGLGQVNIIDFEGNQIIYLDELIFSNNRNLTNLSLADNKLTRFNQKTFKPILSSISSLDLSMNPIDCNCDLKWLIYWINKPIHLIDRDKTICSSESLEPFREKPLLDVDPNELCILNGLLFLIPLASIGLVVISVLLYHFRWQLRYKLFLLKLAAVGYKEMRDARDHNDYEFDVNIIFFDDGEDDEEWIREQLRPALGERLPQFQRNVFGDEDLVLGMHYLDSVHYVVSHSYKTIIVLSRAAVQDRWFILKFRTAMDHVSDTLTEFVVVVFLEDIPDDEMPFLARLYLNDGRPYIHWTEDARGQECFWDELTKNLTIT
eukprot:XP_011660563.1 PREDICTED: slit homolog 3 protein-like [Strongylocentrotus purpuratus]